MKLLAYVVTSDGCDYSLLIFAETANKAKYFALGCGWYEYSEYPELRAHREPKADQFAEAFGAGMIDHTVEGNTVLRNLGWFELDSENSCEKCQKHHWLNLPESKLVYIEDLDPLCQGCIDSEIASSTYWNKAAK